LLYLITEVYYTSNSSDKRYWAQINAVQDSGSALLKGTYYK